MFKKYLSIFLPTVALLSTLQSMSAPTYKSSQHRKNIEATKRTQSIKMSKSTGGVKRSRTNQLGANLGTEFQFDNLSVHGRYQGPFQGVATVENEKDTMQLIDYRREYKDRLKQNVSEL